MRAHAVAVAVAATVLGCGVVPTAPDASTGLPEAPRPYFRWHGAPTSAQMAYADMALGRIAPCVGAKVEWFQDFPIWLTEAPQGLDTQPWPLYAYDVRSGSQVAACGASTPTRIEVVNIPECFEGGLPTEIMHVALWKTSGSGNRDYTSSLWAGVSTGGCRWW